MEVADGAGRAAPQAAGGGKAAPQAAGGGKAAPLAGGGGGGKDYSADEIVGRQIV